MVPKTNILNILLPEISSPAAIILKQEMLSAGGDAAIARGVITGEVKDTDVLLMGTAAQIRKLISKLHKQPFNLGEIAKELALLLQRKESPPLPVKIGGRNFEFGDKTFVMGILNVTPDSFYEGSRYPDTKKAIQHGIKMAEKGADIIDVGGESTRPGSREISIEEELERVVPVVKELSNTLDVPISIDTRKSRVAYAAIEAGASMVNDVSGLRFDPDIIEVVKAAGAALCVVHSIGTPQNMQERINYRSLINEIYIFFVEKIEMALSRGVNEEKIIIDPGIGFGKKVEHNVEILARLGEFRSLGRPLLVGPSRKSFIGAITGKATHERLSGSISAVAASVLAGADFVRAHDVSETIDAIKVARAVRDY